MNFDSKYVQSQVRYRVHFYFSKIEYSMTDNYCH